MSALDFPASPTVGQQATLTNGFSYQWDGAVWTLAAATGALAGGDLQGSYPNPTIKPTSLPWTPSGTTLAPTDATKNTVAVPGDATTATVLLGNATAKGRVQMLPGNPGGIGLFGNRNFVSNAQDDATKPSWGAWLNINADQLQVQRSPAGSTTQTGVLTLDATGNLTCVNGSTNHKLGAKTNLITGANTSDFTINDSASLAYNSAQASWLLRLDCNANALQLYNRVAASGPGYTVVTFQADGAGNLTISGPIGVKSAGTTWANPSDIRLKRDVAPYARGLTDLLRLDPITYRLKAAPDRECYGFDAAAVRAVMPECVSETRMKLSPDDVEETDGVLLFDMHPILVALINAVKELAAKVDNR